MRPYLHTGSKIKGLPFLVMVILSMQSSIVNAQAVINSAGQTSMQGGVILDSNVGEVAVYNSSAHSAGYLQPELIIKKAKALPLNTRFELFPNPAVSMVSIRTETPQRVSAALYDISGKEIDSFKWEAAEYSFSVNSLPQGTYLVRLSVAGSKTTESYKLIKSGGK